MRKFKTILMVALAVAFLFVPSFGSLAAETTDTNTYKITISAGKHGTIEGSDKISKDVPAGQGYSFGTESVVLNTTTATDEAGNVTEVPSKYFAKGFRISGRDELYAEISLLVQEDTDYVVVYGVAGNQTLYTVEYVDANGNALAEPDKFYGNIGDKPIVAGKYIAGYAPQAFALTGTLVENPTESSEVNNFKFIYTPSQIDYYERVTAYVDGGTYTVYTAGGAAGGGAGGAGGGATNVTGGGAGAVTPGDENAGGGAGGGVEGPSEIIDLDDEETPLANIDVDSESAGKALPLFAYVGMGLAAILAIIAMVYASQKLKKKE